MNTETLLISLLFILLLPLVAGVFVMIIPNQYRWLTPIVSSLLILTTTIIAILVCINSWGEPTTSWQSTWFTLGEKEITIGILLNNVTLILLFIVSFISLMVHIFSIGYMAGDKGEQRYFGVLGFFTFAMLGLVLADNVLLLFVFWELVGFSSYMLIGHWYERNEATSAAKKAFIVNRVADLGFIVALLIIWTHVGSFSIPSFHFEEYDPWRTAASLCIVFGVMGKSAQFPFFNWLSGAMEGPTPVSALIHAATMVVAGVFLLIRIFPLFTPEVLDVVVIVGCLTALLGALAALYQFDFKKILAYSTISQLGLMVAAVGSGAYGVALLHLFTHAFFKAGLFLSAGAVIHSLHQAQHSGHVYFDVQDIRNLGGLKNEMPITTFCFGICAAALVGMPLFSGFQSKDAILISIFDWSEPGWKMIFALMLVATSILTLFYTVRMLWFVFLSDPRKTSLLTIQEVPTIMRIPLILLSIGSLWWMVSVNPLEFSGWLLEPLQVTPTHNLFITWLSMILVPTVSVLVFLWYKKREEPHSLATLREGYYLDNMNSVLVAKPVMYMATVSQRMDKRWIDGMIHGFVYLTVGGAHLLAWFDRYIIDGVVDMTGRMAMLVGSIARSFSGGKIQSYIFWSVFAVIIFLFWVLFF